MNRSTEEIASREFSVVRRGYAPEEVRRYLVDLAKDLKGSSLGAPSTPAQPAEGATDPVGGQPTWRETADAIARLLEAAEVEAAHLISSAEGVVTDVRREVQAEVAQQREEIRRAAVEAEDRAAAIVRAAEDKARVANDLATARRDLMRTTAAQTEAAARLRRVQNLVTAAIEAASDLPGPGADGPAWEETTRDGQDADGPGSPSIAGAVP